MGHQYSKPEDRLHAISREINSLKSSLRTSRQNITKERKSSILETLAQQSSEVNSMNGKVKRKHMEETLTSIRAVMEEVLKIEPIELDGGTVESDSFVNIPVKRGRSKSSDSQQGSRNMNSQATINKRTLPNLRDIEAKVGTLKSEISNAIDNQNSKELKEFSQNLQSLATDLELIPTKRDISLEKRRESVYRKIMFLNHKVHKSLNFLLKYENSQNQSKLQRKEKAMADLSEIEVHLVENQSLLDRSTKEKIPVDVPTIRNNIVENNQKLSHIDLVDREVKEKVSVLSQKITEIVNILDNLMAKREFNSKFAKSLEAFERITRNFDSSTNATDTVNQLQRLRNSIENLEEINDTTKNRKTQLLSDVKRQINTINEALKKESDEKIVKKLVEDNVILRKKVQSKDEEYTFIDQFTNYWDNVKSNFNVNCYSHLSLLRIDGMLGEMQQSINDLRLDIANKCDTIPGHLNMKYSQSAPKLNNRKSYGSNRSLDQLDGNIIRTKAKIYNISTSTSHLENPKISKIEDIKLQARYIKEKINGSHNNNALKDKLEFYSKDLHQFVKDSDKEVATRAALVSNEITELLYKICLAEYKEEIQTLFSRVKNFNGTRYDKEFDEVKNDLVKIQLTLEHFNIPPQYVSLTQEKGELIDEVGNVIEELQEKGSHHKRYEGEVVNSIKAQLHDLNEKVKRFSGTYKGVLYNNIERELNRLLLDAGEHVEEKVWSDEIAKEAEKLLKILEQRSHLTQSFKADKSKEWESGDQIGMTKIKRDLFNIKKQIDRTPENNVNDFIGLQSRLDLVNLELSQITARSDENLAKEKEICINEVQTLKNVVDAKVALRQKPMLQWPERELQSDVSLYPRNDAKAEIEQIENSFLTIKKEIASPSNEEDVHKYYKLAQDIKKLIEKLSRHKFMTGTDAHIKQLNTLREMQYYVEVLEKEVHDVNYVLSMEEKIDKLKSIFESEQKYDIQAMAKELQAIQKKLQEHQLNSNNEMLRSRKTSVQQMTDNLTQKLRKLEYSESQELMEETRKIEDSERRVRSFAPEILSFSGLKTDDKYYELNEATIRMIIVLDKLHIRNAELQKRRIKLLKELHVLGQALDERAQQAQELVNLEQEMDNIAMMISSFSNNDDEMQMIKCKMEALKSQLQELEVTENLTSRKNSCLQKFNAFFNKVVALDNSVTIQSKTFATETEQSSPNFIAHTYRFISHVANSNEHDTLARIGKELENMTSVVNSTNDKNQLQDLDDALTKYTIELQNLKYKKDSPQYFGVQELYQKIENLVQYIEGRINDIDLLSELNHKLDQISNKMDTPLTEEQINQIHEELVQLEDRLGKTDSAALKEEKDACMMRIILCLQKIRDYKGSIP